MRRTILTLAAVLAATTAYSQESIHTKKPIDPEAGLPAYQRKYMPPPDPIGDVPPGWKLVTPAVLVPPERELAVYGPPLGSQPAVAPVVAPVVIRGGPGGWIEQHKFRFGLLKMNNATVEMRGGCWSACTLITSYIPKEKLCFEKGSFLAFHAARTAEQSSGPNSTVTLWMYGSYPAEIRQWIDRHGGPDKMTIESYWTMYDHELWAIGYPRCK